MKIVKVTTKKQKKQFLNMVSLIYKNDQHYVRPLDDSIEEVFDPKRNEFFNYGEAERFILIDDKEVPIGRIAAFINKKKAFGFDQPTGGMGFFESINDQNAAFLLFDTAKNWLKERGMEAMDGPINFGENDNFWGLLTDGFTHPGLGMQYNPPYYKDFFENYGFVNYFEQVSNHLDLTKPFPERFWKIAERIINKPEYSFKHFNWKDSEQFIADFVKVYDDAWRFHENFTPMNPDTLRKTLKDSKSFMLEQMIWFAYHNNDPIAFLIMFPDINQILKHLNGKLHLLNKIRFLYHKLTKTMTRSRIVIMGVAPHYQRIGIESGIFWHLRDVMSKMPHYTEVELSWVGDFNPRMRALHESVGATFAKRHITFRYIFDDQKRNEKRATAIPLDPRTLKKE
ncbi:MAG: GNAT family N-acetyltransferase [Marinilabiliaceae bacterium]|nr:GNAT family N-acetyltransferase [Marinilabiliaceae bacterium]